MDAEYPCRLCLIALRFAQGGLYHSCFHLPDDLPIPIVVWDLLHPTRNFLRGISGSLDAVWSDDPSRGQHDRACDDVLQ